MSHASVWPNGQRAAISLTYDDALPVHREEVAPALNERSLTATFYVPIDSDLLTNRAAWVGVARAGHELGNHTIFHPCRNPGNAKGWPAPHRNLCDYTLARWEDEVRVASRILQSYDGRDARSFGNTCHDIVVGLGETEAELDDPIGRLFVCGRGASTERAIDPLRANFTRLGCCTADGRTFDELRREIDDAIERGAWIIYCAHGVGRDHRLVWSPESHEQTLDYLASRRPDIWTAPVADVAAHLRRRDSEMA
jgi:peptidoglycan/xylan/chitin deacetylase (PgdA/CDA1 family)